MYIYIYIPCGALYSIVTMGTSYGYDHVQMLGAETQETCHGALQTGSRSCDLDWMIHWLHVVKIMGKS